MKKKMMKKEKRNKSFTNNRNNIYAYVHILLHKKNILLFWDAKRQFDI